MKYTELKNQSTAMHYENILDYLSLWSEVQFLNVQNSKNIQEIRKPN